MDLDAYFGHAAPPSGEGFKSGFVTLIGRPNAGKSTLLNTIMGKKIAITSNTAQTTRHRFRAVYTRDDMQMIIVDTPGLHKPHDALGEELNTSALKALEDVDVIAMLIDASKPVGRGDEWVAAQLDGPHCKHAEEDLRPFQGRLGHHRANARTGRGCQEAGELGCHGWAFLRIRLQRGRLHRRGAVLLARRSGVVPG